MLTSLDPHSSFMNAKRFREMRVQTSGEFGGLGMMSLWKTGPSRSWPRSTIPRPTRQASWANDSSPTLMASRSGTDPQRSRRQDAGKVNTTITLTIQREGKEPFDVKVVRDTIRVRSVKFNIESNDIGYIRISSSRADPGRPRQRDCRNGQAGWWES